MSRKYRADRVLNPLPRRIFRTRITRVENVVSAALVAVIGLAGVWVLAQRNNYDPSERDISMEALEQGRIAELPYHAPMRRWGEVRGGDVGPDLGVFPESLLAGGWQLDGRVESYDPSNLYEKINGQAEQYLTFGFRMLHYVTLVEAGTYVTLELYDQSLFRNALGVFASQRDPSQPVEKSGPLHFYRTSVGAVGLGGSSFFKITASESSPIVRAKTDLLLEMLGGMAENAGASDPGFSILSDRLGVPFEKIAFVNENAFQYEFMREVWFGEIDQPAGARVFIHRAGGDAETLELYNRLVSEQGYEHDTVVDDENRTLMRHEFLETFFAVARQGGWLYGVEGVKDRAVAERLLARLRGELS